MARMIARTMRMTRLCSRRRCRGSRRQAGQRASSNLDRSQGDEHTEDESEKHRQGDCARARGVTVAAPLAPCGPWSRESVDAVTSGRQPSDSMIERLTETLVRSTPPIIQGPQLRAGTLTAASCVDLRLQPNRHRHDPPSPDATRHFGSVFSAAGDRHSSWQNFFAQHRIVS